MSSKVYAIKNGRNPGIYHSWKDCEAEVKNFPGALFKKFNTEDEAQQFLNACQIDVKEDKYDAYIYGGYDQLNNNHTCGVVITCNDHIIDKFSQRKRDDSSASLKQIAGELMGVKYAVNYCRKNNFHNLTIHYNHQGIAAWPSGEWKIKNPWTFQYVGFIIEAKHTCSISFAKNKNSELNNIAKSLSESSIA